MDHPDPDTHRHEFPSTEGANRMTDAEHRERHLDARFQDSTRWRSILDAAAAEFAAKGYDASSISHIAERVGISKPSVYHYISTKEDLLFHVLLEIHDSHLTHFTEYAKTPGGPVERLRSFIEGHVRVNIKEIERGSIFYMNFDALSPPRRELIIEKRRKFDDFIRTMFREGKQLGQIREDLNEDIAALGILTAINSLWLWWDPDRRSEVDVPRQFADLFIAGVVRA